MRDGGWMGLDCDPEYGGQGMPYVMGTAVGEMFASANMAFNIYQGLTHGAYSAIHVHGSEAPKENLFAKHGRWFLDRHHEPDRTAVRHRPGPGAHQSRATG